MKIGFVDYYLDEWHANNYPKMIKKASGGAMEVSCAYAMIDSPIGGLTTDAWCEKYQIERCFEIEQVVARSDALVVLSPDNCEMHEQLCQIPLSSGKTTYVDKTFAPDRATAAGLFALAERHGTPFYSASALRCASEYAHWDGGEVTALTSIGPSLFENYSIHQLEPITMLIPARPVRVMALVQGAWTTLAIEFEDGRAATMVCTGGDAPFMMQVNAEAGSRTVEVKSDYMGGFIGQLVKFLETGMAPVSPQETITIMALRRAGLEAIGRPGQWVPVNG
ncbi:hypothetical protein LJC60_06445 [Ruminococcaceae bacterium OttesenSCG-928-D13]|nr:hypothetical protein [Ruminococcaceae bacterium OttesenSCG-928-D13]